MLVNRDEIARRIARRGGYNVGDIIDVLKLYEDVIVDALQDGEDIKQGKAFRITMQEVPEKRAYNGISKEYFIREPKRVPKLKTLSRLDAIELPPKGEATEDGEED